MAMRARQHRARAERRVPDSMPGPCAPAGRGVRGGSVGKRSRGEAQATQGEGVAPAPDTGRGTLSVRERRKPSAPKLKTPSDPMLISHQMLHDDAIRQQVFDAVRKMVVETFLPQCRDNTVSAHYIMFVLAERLLYPGIYFRKEDYFS